MVIISFPIKQSFGCVNSIHVVHSLVGGGGAYLGMFGPVHEDIIPSICIINLTPLVYKNLTFHRSKFVLMIWKKGIDH